VFSNLYFVAVDASENYSYAFASLPKDQRERSEKVKLVLIFQFQCGFPKKTQNNLKRKCHIKLSLLLLIGASFREP